jgi:CO/xanthine dehydrogenase Mo-binding subunit
MDPIDIRLKYLKDQRACTVIEGAAKKAGWGDCGSPSREDGSGRGIAFARYKNSETYTAVIVHLRVQPTSGHINLERVIIAADCGQIVNPDGVSNQLEGSFIQSASMTLKEHVCFDRNSIISSDWYSYPILRFPGIPKIEFVLINQPGLPYLGVGEVAQGPTPAAIANAIFDAVGVRMREIPFLPGRILAGIQEKHK